MRSHINTSSKYLLTLKRLWYTFTFEGKNNTHKHMKNKTTLPMSDFDSRPRNSNSKVGHFQIGKVYEDIKRIYVLCSWQDYQKTWQYLGGGKFRDCGCNALAEPDIDNLTNSEMTPERFCQLSGSIADDVVKFQASLEYTGN